MSRKSIPEATQHAILLKSRRRCCLCFWLAGCDEVTKGQIAHLDQDNENNAESNLVFLCMNHHDDYDGTTRLSKGLTEKEVRTWRDELYSEMHYRFRTVKTLDFELSVVSFHWLLTKHMLFTPTFRLKNIGNIEARSPVVSIRLPPQVIVKIPDSFYQEPESPKSYMDQLKEMTRTPVLRRFPDPFALKEERGDFFEQNGRVAIKYFPTGSGPLMPDHSLNFKGIAFPLLAFPESSILQLDYRIDAEGHVPTVKQLTSSVWEVGRMIVEKQ